MKEDGRLNPVITASVEDKNNKDNNKQIGQELIFLKRYKKSVGYFYKQMIKAEKKKLEEVRKTNESLYPFWQVGVFSASCLVGGVVIGTLFKR
jgi:hypothetical protein